MAEEQNTKVVVEAIAPDIKVQAENQQLTYDSHVQEAVLTQKSTWSSSSSLPGRAILEQLLSNNKGYRIYTEDDTQNGPKLIISYWDPDGPSPETKIATITEQEVEFHVQVIFPYG